MPAHSVNMGMMFWAVVVAGGLGVGLRYFIISYMAPFSSFPWAVIAVNLAGSFFAGVLFALFRETDLPKWVQPLVLTGFMGGLTTFSAFTVDAVLLFEKTHFMSAFLYLALSVLGGVFLAAIGFLALRFVLG